GDTRDDMTAAGPSGTDPAGSAGGTMPGGTTPSPDMPITGATETDTGVTGADMADNTADAPGSEPSGEADDGPDDVTPPVAGAPEVPDVDPQDGADDVTPPVAGTPDVPGGGSQDDGGQRPGAGEIATDAAVV